MQVKLKHNRQEVKDCSHTSVNINTLVFLLRVQLYYTNILMFMQTMMSWMVCVCGGGLSLSPPL